MKNMLKSSKNVPETEQEDKPDPFWPFPKNAQRILKPIPFNPDNEEESPY